MKNSAEGNPMGAETPARGGSPQAHPHPRLNLLPNSLGLVRESRVRLLRAETAARVLAAALGWWIFVSPLMAASLPPRFRFKTLEAQRVKVHFHSEVERPARRVMALVLEILPGLEARYGVRVPSLDIVVHDASDSPNGLATAFPYPYVEIRTASPDGADSGPHESWLRMVVTHELTHIVHIEQAGGLYAVGRRLFGRAPFLFPNALQPTWFIEGLAVREETRGTAFGRGRHTFTKMVVDEAARRGQLARIDQATLGLDSWPFGNAAYLFGEEFLSGVDRRFGKDTSRDIASAHARAFRPYLDERTFRKVTGRGLGETWREFALERSQALQPEMAPARLTTRGVVQTSPRLSPDGALLAYTSRTLDHLGEIRLMKPDGSEDRRLASSLSGGTLSWSRDGRFIFFDESNRVRKFETRSDIYRVELSTGRRKRLTIGQRASEPDAGPAEENGAGPVVFVQRFPDRSELGVLSEDGSTRVLTASSAGTEWSHPRFSPSGDVIVASRLQGGFSDLVRVDAQTGAFTPLIHDRALDVEPSWVDDNTVIFRSDREDNAFRLFLVNRDGSGLRRVVNSPGNAFTPEVDLRTNTVFFAHYSGQGYDLARAPFKEGEDVGAFMDPFPENVAEPTPFAGEARPYRSISALRPRFVSPFAEIVSDEWRVGLATASFDPLLRATYGLAGSWGTEVSKANLLGYLRYDRFTPTFSALGRLEWSPSGARARRLSEARVSVDFPLERSHYREQSVGITLRKRHEDVGKDRLMTGVAALGWQLDSTRTYPMSISPQDGVRLRVALTRELKPLGSAFEFAKAIVDARAYTRMGKTVVVSRLGGGWAFGSRVPESAFAVGGLASPALLDPVGDEPSVLRGYETPDGRDISRYGRKLAFANLDWRIPLAHPQRGVGALPFFVRHLHLTASIDAAVIGARTLDAGRGRIGASIAIGADIFVGHRIPLTLQGGVGRGLNRDGRTVPWFSLGFPF